MTQRFFTVAEAEALLPELNSALEEVKEARRELERASDRIQLLDGLWGEKIRAPENPDREEFLREKAALEGGLRRLERLVEERVLSLGVRFPVGGLEHGLVDFPARFEGRTIYLCWRLGEEDIMAWHEMDSGFAGRRPLTEEDVLAMGRERDIE
ncbi:MAG: DUF2203 family protein [Gemmatimonadetes bacterium]|nr:DUF2203 family protein [Gemmatimonadota bacterium]